MTPAETILEHLPAVREAFRLAPGALGAWGRLVATCPEVTAAMTFNTFKAVAPVVLLTAEPPPDPDPDLGAAAATPPRATPATFMDWTVQTNKKGYIRLHRKVGGKVWSVYIGKDWDAALARERIVALTAAAPG